MTPTPSSKIKDKSASGDESLGDKLDTLIDLMQIQIHENLKRQQNEKRPSVPPSSRTTSPTGNFNSNNRTSSTTDVNFNDNSTQNQDNQTTNNTSTINLNMTPSSFLQNSTSQDNTLGQNEFSQIVTTANKIRYSDMESSLKNCYLMSDSQHHLKLMYNNITKSIAFALGKEVTLFPNYTTLDRNVNFKHLLLSSITGSDLLTSMTVFNRLGTIIHSFITSTNIVSSERSPLAYDVMITYSLLDGWSLLQQLLLDRAVVCGAPPDIDIDSIRVNLQLMKDESIRDFYIRTMQMINEYNLTRSPQDVPMTKIVSTFIRELSRASIWIPYISSFQLEMIKHINQHGDLQTLVPPPFQITDIYKHMKLMKVPLIPTNLAPYATIDPLILTNNHRLQPVSSKPTPLSSHTT
jgi:hypothetical protein